MNLLFKTVACLLLFGMLRATSVQAEIYTWQGTDWESWNDSGNWTPPGMPGGGDTAYIENGTTAALSGFGIAGNLYLGNSNTGGLANYGYTFIAASSMVVGYGAAAGTYTQSDGSLSGNISVGYGTGGGTIYLSGGSISTSSTSPFNVGAGNGSGIIYQSGGTLNLGATMNLGAGSTGDGTIDLSDGLINGNSINIGASTANGTITQTGETLRANTINIGNAGAGYMGTYDLSAGTMTNYLTSPSTVTVGCFENGTLHVHGTGTANMTDLNVANGGTGGQLKLDDSTVSITVTGTLTMGTGGGGGTPTVTQTDGTMTVGTLARGFGGPAGTYNLSGGTLNLTGAGSHTVGVLHMTGGTIDSPGTLSSDAVFEVYGGTVNAVLDGSGINLQKTESSDTVILTKDNTYTGQTLITIGTLQIGDGGTAGNVMSDISLLSPSASLVFNRSNDFTYANVISNGAPTCSVTKQGGGKMTLTGANTFSNTFHVDAGALALAGGTLGNAVTIDNDALFSVEDALPHTVGAITGTGETCLAPDAQLTVSSITQNTLIIGSLTPLANAAPVPEPSVLILLATAGLGVLQSARRRRQCRLR